MLRMSHALGLLIAALLFATKAVLSSRHCWCLGGHVHVQEKIERVFALCYWSWQRPDSERGKKTLRGRKKVGGQESGLTTSTY